MEYITTNDIKFDKGTIITLGNFDGVHIGHQKLIEKLFSIKDSIKEDYLTTVFSFNPHPKCVVKNIPFKTIFDKDERKLILEDIGVDVLVEYPFDENTMNMSSQSFVKDVLIDKLNAKYVVIGEDYTFGKNKEGNVNYLKECLEKYSVEVFILETVLFKNQKISSTDIRQSLIDGDMKNVEALLNKPYFILGKVVHGKELGRTIGFPTMNVLPDKNKLLPHNGVYITEVLIDGVYRNALTNVGVNPTVNGDQLIVETHVLDYSGDFYDKLIKINFIDKIRDEKKFNSLDELKAQISSDILSLKSYKNL